MVRDAMLHCGELAKATGVSADTIRHYERIGVLPRAARTASGYRIYPETAIKRVIVVRRALRIGFTLAELADIFKTRDAGGIPCHRVFELAQMKLTMIESDIAALSRIRRQMVKILADWSTRIKKSGGEKAHLLQSLTDVVGDLNPGRLRRRR